MGRLNMIDALKETAARLGDGAAYQWGHAGQCNCGHLAQTVTALDRREIYRMVAGEWTEHLNTACPISGLDLDDVAARMIQFGFSAAELTSLEHLSDRRVLSRLPEGQRHLRKNQREDVVLYLETWAAMLADERARDLEPA